MKETSGADYQSSNYGKVLVAAYGKEGKTCSLVAGLLGQLPWQKDGGVVDAPHHLHVITTDTGALNGVARFITQSCKGSVEATKFRAYNMEDDVKKLFADPREYNDTFYFTVQQTLESICQKIQREGGTHAIVWSSLTGFSNALLRGVAGAPSAKKSSMDQNKWSRVNAIYREWQMNAHLDIAHCIWEGHVQKGVSRDLDDNGKPQEAEVLAMQSTMGKNWAFDCSHVFKMRRTHGQKFPGTIVDKTYLDTKPTGDFVAGGRGTNELLEAQEPCITSAFKKLGLKVGGWKAAGKPSVAAVPKKAVKPAVDEDD